MVEKVTKIRLYVDQSLKAGQSVLLRPNQAHYLFVAMRQRCGAQILLFNGSDGEWRAEIAQLDKRSATLTLITQTSVQKPAVDLCSNKKDPH